MKTSTANPTAPRFSPRFIGAAQVLLSTFCFGAIGTFAKLAYATGLDSSLLLTLRFLVAALVMWSYYLLFNRDAVRIGRKELLICAGLGLAGYGIFSTLTFKAFETIPTSITVLIFFSYPVFVVLLDWLVSRDRVETQKWMGAAATVAGIGVGVFGTLAGNLSVGLLLAVGAAAWYAAYVVTTRRLLYNLNPQTVALYVTSFAVVGFWLMSGPVLAQLPSVSARGWILVLLIAVVSTVMALLSFFSGLEKLGSSEASQLGSFELIVSLSLATLVLGESITLPVVGGAALIFSGIVMSQIRIGSRVGDCPEDAPCN